MFSGTPSNNYSLEAPLISDQAFIDQSKKRNETRIRRGFSKAIHNEQLVREARTKVLEDISESLDTHAPFLQETPDYTFVLPDLLKYATEFRAFLEKELVETSTMVALEQSGHLNWWSDAGLCERLWPMATTGDGNCLLHAASLAMWGFHDRLLILRHALHHRLLSDEAAFYRHWRWQTYHENQKVGLTLSESEWQTEWESVKRLSSPSPKGSPVEPSTTVNTNCDCSDGKGVKRHIERSTSCGTDPGSPVELMDVPRLAGEAGAGGPGDVPVPNGGAISPGTGTGCTQSFAGGGAAGSGPYESLEHVHVFVLAHVIRRPIVVIADPMLRDADGEPLQPSPFGGVYLPLLDRPDVCHHDPLLLAYSNSHFSALVPMSSSGAIGSGSGAESTQIRAIPLVDWTNQLLPVHFAVDPGAQWRWSKDEFDVKKVKKVQTAVDELRLLDRYLRCLRVSVPPTCNHAESPSPWGSVEGEERAVINNATGGLLAPPPNHNASGTSSKDIQKKEGKNESGSLGRAIGRQLKKTFSVKRKAGSTTQSTRRPSSEWTSAAVPSGPAAPAHTAAAGVQCAMIGQKLPPRYLEMLENYIANAEERFAAMSVLHRRRSREIVARAEARRLSMSGLTACANAGCSMYSAGADTNFLCSVCFRAQQREAERLSHASSSASASASASANANANANGDTRTASPPAPPRDAGERCRSDKCAFYGKADQLGFCSRCYRALGSCKTPSCGRKADVPEEHLCSGCHAERERHLKSVVTVRTSWL